MSRAPAAIASIVLLLASLSACGFTPVYGPALKDSGAISIPEIQGRTGHFLRQELIRTVGRGVPGVVGSAELEIKLTEAVGGVSFAPDQAASRSDYLGYVTWTLRKGDGVTIATGTAHEAASFNVANLAYADISAQTAAQQRVADLLARTIRDQLIINAGKGAGASTAAPKAPVAPNANQPIRGVTSTQVSPIDPVETPPFKQ